MLFSELTVEACLDMQYHFDNNSSKGQLYISAFDGRAGINGKGRDLMEYTDRVILNEDGVYRWFYDLDMRKDFYMLTVTLKALAVMAAVFAVMIIFMPSGGMSKWKVAGITFGCIAGVAALALLIYLFLLWRGGGFYRYRYDMTPEGVHMKLEDSDVRRNQGLSAAVTATGVAAGQAFRAAALSASMRAAEGAGYTAYSSVRRVVEDRSKDCIYLKLLVGENCIYVSRDDYDFVRDYIVNRLKEGTAVVRM